jgi:phosphate transport system protein
MREHFEARLGEIGVRLADEAGAVDVAIHRSVEAFLTQDSRLAGSVIDADLLLDRQEVELERMCLDTMALQQPMAKDLRFLAGAMKINSDLERMGDLACNIAKQSWRVTDVPNEEFAGHLRSLGEKVRKMVRSAADALVRRDSELARVVWASDDRADRVYRNLIELSIQMLKEDRVTAEDASCYIAAGRNLERIGDHAQNIAEDVVFIVEGDIVRHNVEARIAPDTPDGL